MKKLVAVVVPFYKVDLSYNEQFSLKQCFDVLQKYPIVAVKPKSLNIDQGKYPFTAVVSFDDHYFQNVHGYNQLMLSTHFYEILLGYEFILIYQLDALVFSDELTFWCERGYDYIGAPWLYSLVGMNFFKKQYLLLQSYFYRRFNKYTNGLPDFRQLINGVGNGGLSLRRVQKFYDLSIKYAPLAEMYKNRKEVSFNEDIFWSIEVNRKRKNLKIPDYKTALKFSFENDLLLSCYINHLDFPFGCHAFDKHIAFWMPNLEELGYEGDFSKLNEMK